MPIEITKPKRKKSLGQPPAETSTQNNLQEPESAPAANEWVDGRALRRTGRVVQFGTKVHPDFKVKMAELSKLTGKNYNVILEESIKLFESNMAKG